ncbi:hypothetical protein OR1_02623 [Geobacter sp. OR-1]|uniref:DUF4258 domain-containing protein n=1 Tax=Geobacter sp. OR-1 TaxID=1266765 RepID=UPI00054406D6|nr:hypothetical protein OR1_02623 [Geobacter sp. OR-1]
MASTALQSTFSPDYFLTNHARSRMFSRAISADEIDLVISFGRVIHTRGAAIYVVGHKEVSRYQKHGVNLFRCEGVHVVCSPDGAILTVYRNNDLSALRDKARRSWH